MSSWACGSAAQDGGLIGDTFRKRPHLQGREDMGVSEFGQVPGEQKQLSLGGGGGTERIL